ncbi:dihydroorotase [Thiohalomonas denitrificans]|uniref:Dihydroorotase n=1 Tax=Thiohalomonas denitrificans TaxID=415747 RepID=A0A1G5QJV7_9GAMM|nr:dihydroorotase [Thiohalomonas denitrificans]SCZ61886.1 dihydroorotase [Thiohalomonas denitrificans]
MSGAIHIRGGRLVDPSQNLDREADLFIRDGRMAGIGTAPPGFEAQRTINAAGRVVCPGLIDLQSRLREPGQEHKGTIASETAAAAASGITTLCCPPDTDPVIDNPAVAEQILYRAGKAGNSRVLPLGALTARLAGEHLAEMLALQESGCIAVSNASRPVHNTLVMRRALEYAATLGLTVFINSEDPWLGGHGCLHEGQVSTRLGLPGIPECAEVIGISRDLILVERTGVRAHFSRLSTARAVEMVAAARARGLPVTCDVTAHQLFLTEMDIGVFDSLCHVRPPLRTFRDRDGLRAALADGVITSVCSDHQPHDPDAKLAPFSDTEPGISALETLLPLLLRLADEKVLPRSDALARLTIGPAEVLGNGLGTLALDAPADVCIFDPEAWWQVSEETLVSRGKNTPLLGWELKGRVTHTLLEGRIVFERQDNH